jgi:hypothetical protein
MYEDIRVLFGCLVLTCEVDGMNQEPKLLEEINLPPNYKTYRSLKVHHGTPPEWLDYLPKGIGVTMFQ